MIIKMFDYVGDYGENKDIARTIRLKKLLPALQRSEEVTLDFDGVTGVTQSFIHALIADPIREYPDRVFDRVIFKNCTRNIKVIVEIVEEYMQESLV